MPCWIAAAHDSARLGPVNINMIPSPVVFTSMPPVASAALRSTAKCAWRRTSAARGPRRDASAVEPTRSVKRNEAVIGVLTAARLVACPSITRSGGQLSALQGIRHYFYMLCYLQTTGTLRRRSEQGGETLRTGAIRRPEPLQLRPHLRLDAMEPREALGSSTSDNAAYSCAAQPTYAFGA